MPPASDERNQREQLAGEEASGEGANVSEGMSASTYVPPKMTCSTLREAGCDCSSCCVETLKHLEAFQASLPTPSASQWIWSRGAVSQVTRSFEVLADEVVGWTAPPPPPVERIISTVRVPCTGGLNGHRFEGLKLAHTKTVWHQRQPTNLLRLPCACTVLFPTAHAKAAVASSLQDHPV